MWIISIRYDLKFVLYGCFRREFELLNSKENISNNFLSIKIIRDGTWPFYLLNYNAMISYKVSIPENKQSFFQEFLNMIGADYEKKSDGFELSKEQEKMLDQRLEQDKENFVPAKETLKQVRQKYDL